MERVLKTGERRAVEVELLHLRRVFQITAVPFPGNEGTPPGAVLTFHDATERQRLERVRRDFVANASHELRTPLTSIRGFVEALEDGALDEPDTSLRFLGKIRTHADRMAALVDDLLELSRLESGERPPRYEEVLPSEVVEDVLASFARLAPESRHHPRARRRHAPRPWSRTPTACAASSRTWWRTRSSTRGAAGGSWSRRRRGPEGGAVFEVRDNGPGIAAEHLPRIFERFYRVDKARSRELGGTGLGLAIVRHLAEGMGATVTVESELGKGTAFRVAVPPGRERLEASVAASPGACLDAGGSRRYASRRHRKVIEKSLFASDGGPCHEGRQRHPLVHAQGGALPRAALPGHPEPAQGRAALRRDRPDARAWTTGGSRRSSSRPSSTTATRSRARSSRP